MNDDLAARLREELVRLRKELDGTTQHSEADRTLLHDSAVVIQRLLALMAARDKRGGKRGDDDGAPGVTVTDPPKRPRGPLPSSAAAAKVEEGDSR
jgi:hypothetical protein